jgi:hypothetical protein
VEACARISSPNQQQKPPPGWRRNSKHKAPCNLSTISQATAMSLDGQNSVLRRYPQSVAQGITPPIHVPVAFRQPITFRAIRASIFAPAPILSIFISVHPQYPYNVQTGFRRGRYQALATKTNIHQIAAARTVALGVDDSIMADNK